MALVTYRKNFLFPCHGWQEAGFKSKSIFCYREGHRINVPHLALQDFMASNAVCHAGLSWSTTNFVCPFDPGVLLGTGDILLMKLVVCT